jgi:hypothetical protein
MLEENNDYDFCMVKIGQLMYQESIIINLDEKINDYTNEITELDNQIKLLQDKNSDSDVILNYFCCCLFDKLYIDKYKYNTITINYLEEQKLQIEDKIVLLKSDYDMC